MAQSNEHRMVFDIRGKRRHVVKAVYAVLALLMAASLFLVVGPVNIGSLFGDEGAGGSNLAGQYEDRAQKIEAELKRKPGDEELLAKLTKARTNAGGQLLATGPNGEVGQTVESRTQYRQASNAWSEYLKAADEPSPVLAQQMAGVLFGLAQVSRSLTEAEANITAAAEAETIYAEARPSLNSLSTQALYLVFTGDYEAAEKANAAAKAKATTKFEREKIDNTFDSSKKRAETFQKELKTSEKESAKAGKEAAEGKGPLKTPESLQNPLGESFGGGGLTE